VARTRSEKTKTTARSKTRGKSSGTRAASGKTKSGRARSARRQPPKPPAWRRALVHARPLVLLGLLLLCVYASVSLATWHPLDPSWSRASGSTVSNAGGPVGAYLADALFQLFGYGSWLVLPAAGALAWKLARRPLGGPLSLLAMAALTWAGLSLVAAVWPASPGADFPAGGLLGEVTVENLRSLLGPAGTWIVLIGVMLASVPFVLQVHLEDLAEHVVGGVEGAAPRVGRVGLHLGRRAVGGVAAAGAAVADRVREARDGGDELDEETGWEGEASDVWEGAHGPVAPGHVAPPTHAGIDDAIPATAWRDAPAPEAPRPAEGLAGPPTSAPTPTQASGRALVEAEWEPTLPPGDDVRDTVPAADMERSSSPLDLALLSSVGDPADLPIPSALDAPDPSGLARRSIVPAAQPPSVAAIVPPADAVHAPPVGVSAAPAASAASRSPSAGPAAAPVATPTARRRVEVDPNNLVSGGSNGNELIADPITAAFELPHLGLLDEHARDVARFDEIELQGLAQTLENKLGDFGVKGEVVAIRPGPVVTTFEYVPAPGIKISKISGLSDDIAMALKALRVRIVAPIPGKGVVGIEIPNKSRQTVWLRDMMASSVYRQHKGALPMSLGKTVEGKPYIADLSKMPHLLVGGTTGSGKSVGVNAMLLTMLFTRSPDELKLILIDPKMLEFELYRDIPHLLHPVVTEPKLASAALRWACTEMDERYRTLSRWGVRNIASYNKKVDHELESWSTEKAWRYAPADTPSDGAPPMPEKMPYIVIVIDELADLMMVAAKDVEESIIRLAQKARAAGIHLIVATQRPSVNVITGLIKANMPSRVAFQVRTKVDGRTILDQNGAENLLGRGDMLFLPPGVSALERLHGPFVSDDEVRRVTDFLRDQGSPTYEAQITASDEDVDLPGAGEEYDELYDLAVAYVCRQGKASASMIQREFRIGYNRAARILEFMEREGVVGPADGARPREVLVASHAS